MKKLRSIGLPAILVLAVVFGTLLINNESEAVYEKRDSKLPISQSWN